MKQIAAWGMSVLTLSLFTGSSWEALSSHVGVSRYVWNDLVSEENYIY